MAEYHVPEHSSPIKTPRQLIIVVVLAFVVPITLLVMITQLVTSGGDFSKANPGMSDEAIAKRLKPVGDVVVVDPTAPRVERSGKEVTEQVCSACHATGALNAPRIGDAVAWGKLMKDGLGTLTKLALTGIRKMPPHGGNPELSDLELERAIVYMVNQSGGKWIEPVGPKPPAERSGEQIVQAQCIKCHATGVGGAPRIGDRAAWLPRVKQGLNVVLRSAIKGHGEMPARGGMADLTDSELRNAILYMFDARNVPQKKPEAAKQAPAVKASPEKGKAVYEANCIACHGAGVAGAPKAGDKAAWAPRIKSGMATLYASTLKGKNAMPPKGGNLALADSDVRAAVDYLVGLAK